MIKGDSRWLLVDAAGPLVQAGVWCGGKWIGWKAARAEAGKSLFTNVEALMRDDVLDWSDLDGFFFCEGPGSMLGLRIAAMAIEGWQVQRASPLPIAVYNSHDLLARSLERQHAAPPFHLISDARRERWNVWSVMPGQPRALRQMDAAALAELPGSFYRMEEVVRSQPPVDARMVSYDLSDAAAVFADETLLRVCLAPEPMSLETPSYKKWEPERIRGASLSKEPRE